MSIRINPGEAPQTTQIEAAVLTFSGDETTLNGLLSSLSLAKRTGQPDTRYLETILGQRLSGRAFFEANSTATPQPRLRSVEQAIDMILGGENG